jgi:hypothetical protein
MVHPVRDILFAVLDQLGRLLRQSEIHVLLARVSIKSPMIEE